MPSVVERELPGAGKLSQQDLHGMAKKSCGVLPANRIARIRSMIDPTTAE